MLSKNNLQILNSSRISILLLLLCLFFTSCKKNDSNKFDNQESIIEEFLKIPDRVSPELSLIVKDLRRQLQKKNFAPDFVRWHGLPEWNKTIKVSSLKKGTHTLLIPCSENGVLRAFITSVIKADGKITFELHRQTSLDNNIPEYSYANFDRKRIQGYINIFRMLDGGQNYIQDQPSNLSNFQQDNECRDCWFVWERCNNTAQFSEDSLDNASGTLAPFCWNEHCYQWPDCIPGEGGPTGGGGTGGGGGCTNCPAPPECSDPLWYSFIPIEDPCDEPPTPPTPCEMAILGSMNATTIYNQTSVQQRRLEILSTISTDMSEKMFHIGKANFSDANYITSNIISGPPGGVVSIPPNSTQGMTFINVFGSVHTHTPIGFNAPSGGDFYSFIDNNEVNNNFQQFFTFSQNNNEYALIITDPNIFSSFKSRYPKATYFDETSGDWKIGEKIYIESDKAFRHFQNVGKSDDEAFELSQAYIANKFQTGITIAKKDGNGNFLPIFVDELPDPNNPGDKIYIKTNICNLNVTLSEI